jgi:hypothetical protein
MRKNSTSLYWVILISILSIVIILFSYLQQTKEYFDILLNNDFPLTKNQNVTSNSASNVWKDYPVFSLGSLLSLTNISQQLFILS